MNIDTCTDHSLKIGIDATGCNLYQKRRKLLEIWHQSMNTSQLTNFHGSFTSSHL
jgi:hypothetical protein